MCGTAGFGTWVLDEERHGSLRVWVSEGPRRVGSVCFGIVGALTWTGLSQAGRMD